MAPSVPPVAQHVLDEAIMEIIASSDLCVSLADPLDPEHRFWTVSKTLASLTGFEPSELIGKCPGRVLGCNLGHGSDLRQVRSSWQRGEACDVKFLNRKKSGELFWHFVRVCGLSVSRTGTSDDRWVLLGAHAEVPSDADDDENDAAISNALDEVLQLSIAQIARKLCGMHGNRERTDAFMHHSAWDVFEELAWRQKSWCSVLPDSLEWTDVNASLMAMSRKWNLAWVFSMMAVKSTYLTLGASLGFTLAVAKLCGDKSCSNR